MDKGCLDIFFQVLGETLPYDTIHQIRGRLAEVAPNLTRYGLVEEANYFDQAAQLAAADKKTKDAAEKAAKGGAKGKK